MKVGKFRAPKDATLSPEERTKLKINKAKRRWRTMTMTELFASELPADQGPFSREKDAPWVSVPAPTKDPERKHGSRFKLETTLILRGEKRADDSGGEVTIPRAITTFYVRERRTARSPSPSGKEDVFDLAKPETKRQAKHRAEREIKKARIGLPDEVWYGPFSWSDPIRP